MLSRARNKSRALRETRNHAEERYFAYEREIKAALDRAYEASRKGDYSGAANELTAGSASLTALVGVCRELSLIYLLTED
jgi:hypothetical protein